MKIMKSKSARLLMAIILLATIASMTMSCDKPQTVIHQVVPVRATPVNSIIPSLVQDSVWNYGGPHDDSCEVWFLETNGTVQVFHSVHKHIE